MRRSLRLLPVVLMLLAGGLPELVAQESGRRGQQDREEMEQRIRAQMQRVTKERLDLTEEESVELTEVVQGFEEQRRALGRAESATRRRIEALMLDGGTHEAEAAELLARVVDLRRQEAELFAAEQEALLGILSAAKVLQLQSLREEMGRRLRSYRRGNGDSGRRRGGQGNVDWILGIDLST